MLYYLYMRLVYQYNDNIVFWILLGGYGVGVRDFALKDVGLCDTNSYLKGVKFERRNLLENSPPHHVGMWKKIIWYTFLLGGVRNVKQKIS